MGIETAATLAISIQILDRFSAPMRAMAARTAELQKQFTATTKETSALEKQLKALAQFGAAGGLGLIGSALTNSIESGVKKAGEFLVTMQMIQDTTAATAQQMNQIQKVIRTSSGQTIFGVDTTAGIAKKLATSGLNADQITQTLPIFTQYAEVQKLGKDSSPNEAIQQAISASHMVGAYDPSQLSSFLNKFNKASFMQPGSTTEFFDTFKYLAPRTQSIMSTDDMLLMSALSNRVGLLSSMGGTNAADAILRSIPGLFGGHGKTPSAQMRGLQALGLDKTIFDANGHFLGVANFLQQLQSASAGRNPMELTKIYHSIFGQQGMSIANILSTKQGQEAMQAIVQQMNTMKSISAMQEDTSKSPAGQVMQLQTNLQNLKLGVFIEMAKQLNPIVKYLNDIVNKMQVFADAHPKIAKYAATFTMIGTGLLFVLSAAAAVAGMFTLLGSGGLIAIGAIALIAAGAILIYKYWGPIKSFMIKLWNDIKDISATAWSKIWSVIGPFVMEVWHTLVSVFTQVREFFGRIWPDIVSIAQYVWPGLYAVIRMQMMNIWTVIKFVGTLIWSTMKAAWTIISTEVKVYWTMMKDTIQFWWDLISGIIVIGLDLLSGHWSKAWSDIKLYAGKIWSDIQTFVSDGWNGIVKIASTWYNTALDWGKNIVNGIVDGVKSIGSTVSSTMGDLWTNYIEGPLKKAAGIASPSKVMAQHGRYLVLGLHQGLTDSSYLSMIANASSHLVNTAVPSSNAVLDRMDGYGSGGDTYVTVNINGTNLSQHELQQVVEDAIGNSARRINMSRPMGPNRVAYS